ncbi:MAG: hypothetical protein ACI82A_002549 [Candidatus Azotimanducaceae bacterium]
MNWDEKSTAILEVEYGSRLLLTTLEGGEYDGDISVTNDITQLVIAIWDRELDRDNILVT